MKSSIKLEIVTPIFIGSGDEYYPQDFFIDSEDNKLYFIDREKFYKHIENNGLLEQFSEVSDNIRKLLGFIDDNFDKSVARDVVDIDYKVANELFETESRPVKAFVKDRFYFTPYIPGSTLKGALRTAILDYKVEQFKDQPTIANIIQEIKDTGCDKRLNGLYTQLETIIFCNENKRGEKFKYDAKMDILKALFVDDLKPDNYKLKIIKPKNRPSKKDKDNTIPVVLETLIEGEFEGEIRVDEHLLKKDNNLTKNRYFQDEPLDIELIKKALNNFYSKINDIEKNRFRANTPSYQDYFIKIGQHSGAGSKSLNDLRKVNIRQIKKCFDYQLSVWIDNNENPLGWAKLNFRS